MFGWFKKKCKHAKSFGDNWPSNMEKLVEFSPYEKDSIGYGVAECNECGKRMFSCIGVHMMGPRACGGIDDFISYKTTWEQFIGHLTKEMKWHKIITQPKGTI